MAAYQQGGAWRDRLCKYLESQVMHVEDFIQAQIPEIVVVRPEASFLVWLNCVGLGLEAASGTQSELCTFMEKQAKVKLNDGYSFGGEETCQYQRINIACSRATLDEALCRLEAAVRRCVRNT